MKAKTENSASTSRVRRAFVLMSILLASFALSPGVQAVSPPPDGGYGGGNTAEGTDALFHLTTGTWNSAFGFRALYNNATGIRNTAIGFEALYNTNGPLNVSGQENVAVGTKALFNNTTGTGNVAIGAFALQNNMTGSNNIAIGNRALQHLPLFSSFPSGNTVIGDSFASDPATVSIGRTPTFEHCNPVDFGTLVAYLYGASDVYIGVNQGGCLK